MPQNLHKNPHYALRIPAETMDKLKYIAAYNGRSANKEIEQLILAHIAHFEKERGTLELSDFAPRSRTKKAASDNRQRKGQGTGNFV